MMTLSLLTLGFFGLLLLAKLPQLALSDQLSPQKGELYDVLSFEELGNIPIVVSAKDDKRVFDAGGLIEFVIQKIRLRFMLNLEGADACRMQMSSKLAQMAARCL